MHAPQVTAAIVTCGGLCPGLNDVVQNIVYTLNDYGVPEDQVCGAAIPRALTLLLRSARVQPQAHAPLMAASAPRVTRYCPYVPHHFGTQHVS